MKLKKAYTCSQNCTYYYQDIFTKFKVIKQQIEDTVKKKT